MDDFKLNEKNSYTLSGFKRGKGDRDIISCRRVLNILVFLGFMVNYMLRVNLTFAIVDMVAKNHTTTEREVFPVPLNRSTRSIKTAEADSTGENFQRNGLKDDTKRSKISWNPFNSLNDENDDGDEDDDDDDDDDESTASLAGANVDEEPLTINGKYRRIVLVSDSLVEDQFSLGNTSSELFNRTGGNTTGNAENTTRQLNRLDYDYVRRFDWSEAQQEYLISCFFWGYLCTEIPGGRLAELIGARKVFGYATLGASVLTLLTPMSAKIHYVVLLICRVLLGLFLGPTWPAILPLATKWIPLEERGKFLSNMMASTLGAGFTLPLCGFIIASLSWEYVFYITGILSFAWSICWFILVFDSPATHPRISDEERYYIEFKLGINSMSNIDQPGRVRLENENSEEKQVIRGLIDGSIKGGFRHGHSDVNDTETGVANKPNFKDPINGAIKDEVDTYALQPLNSPHSREDNPMSDSPLNEKSGRKPKAPWLKIITSIPVLAFVLTHASNAFGYFTITSQLPTYMKYILHYNIKQNGILSSFPYIGKYITAVIGGSIADWLIKSNTMNRATVRKVFTIIGIAVPGFVMVVQVFLGSDKIMSIVIFTVAMMANGFITGGYLGNSLELAPNYSGTIFGLANMFSGICGTLSAIMVGYLTNDNQIYGQWQKIFAITAALYFVGAALFLFFGSTEVQPWNSTSQDNGNNKEKRGNENGK